jgi:hypothetical protein
MTRDTFSLAYRGSEAKNPMTRCGARRTHSHSGYAPLCNSRASAATRSKRSVGSAPGGSAPVMGMLMATCEAAMWSACAPIAVPACRRAKAFRTGRTSLSGGLRPASPPYTLSRALLRRALQSRGLTRFARSLLIQRASPVSQRL